MNGSASSSCELQLYSSINSSFESLELDRYSISDDISDILHKYINLRIKFIINSDAFEYYMKRLEERGTSDTTSYYYIGRCYMLGYGVPQDLQQAYDHLLIAARLQHPNALNDLGQLFGCNSHVNSFTLHKLSESEYRELKVRLLIASASLGHYNQASEELHYLYRYNSEWQSTINKLDELYSRFLSDYFHECEFDSNGNYTINAANEVVHQTQNEKDNFDHTLVIRACRELDLPTENDLNQKLSYSLQNKIPNIFNQLAFIRYLKGTNPSEVHRKSKLLIEAVAFFNRAVDLDCAEAFYNMAAYRNEFVECNANIERTKMDYLIEAASRGHNLAQYELGYQYLDSSSENEQFQGWFYLMLAAKLGYSDSLYMLGIGQLRNDCQLLGSNDNHGIRDVFKIAVVNAELPCARYSKRECFQLGFAYEHGLIPDNEKDKLSRFDQFVVAAHFYAYGGINQLNYYLSLCYLAKLIEKRKIRPCDIQCAISLYELAIDDQDPAICGYANYRLGKLYSNQSLNQCYNPVLADRHFIQAVSKFENSTNSIDSKYHCAMMYIEGLGVIRDSFKAFKLFRVIAYQMQPYSDPYKLYFQKKTIRKMEQLLKEDYESNHVRKLSLTLKY